MASRRGPSQRNAEYAAQHRARQIQSMSPGTAGGRLASASPIKVGSDTVASFDSSSAEVDSLLPAYDTFALTGAAPILTLSFVPSAASLHLYLNGLEAHEGTDYTLDGLTLTILAALDTDSGDVLDARYAYVGGQEIVPADGTAFVDSFDRADSVTTLGSPWTTGSLASAGPSTWGISSNQAYCVSTYQDTFGTIFDSVAYVAGHSADMDVSAVFRNPVIPSSGAGLVIRAEATLNNYFIATANQLIQVAAGSATFIGSYTTNVASGDTLRVTALGATITAYVNGASVLTYTTTALTGSLAGLSGDAFGAPGVRFDDFSLTS